eukprot:TRINITY_DN7264_c0_g1_i1.p1 TRINITY_DN7264_c0_g1~~TRINITY_DN7264_c0_g1_i1.p1  ORF type:complete len:718 (-),score=107.13 TRINITY_DN7264_c0_g1_i1:197-2206(-)
MSKERSGLCTVIEKTQTYHCNCYISCSSCYSSCWSDYYPMCSDLLASNSSGSCCTGQSCCSSSNYCYEDQQCYVQCEMCAAKGLSLQINCDDGSDCCGTFDDLPLFVNYTYSVNDTFFCSYKPDCSVVSGDIPYDGWIAIAVPLFLLVALAHWCTVFACYNHCCDQSTQGAMTAYIFTWWVIIFPLIVLLPISQSEENFIPSSTKWIILNCSSMMMGSALFFVILLNERKRRNRLCTIFAATVVGLSVSILPLLLIIWNNAVGITVMVVVGLLLITGFIASVYSTKLQGYFRPVYKPVRDVIWDKVMATVVTSKELTSYINVKESTIRDELLNYVDNPDLSDIDFIVLDKNSNRTKMYAHRIILYCRAPQLLSILEDDASDVLSIDTSFAAFKHFVELLYAGKTTKLTKDDDDILEEINSLNNSYQTRLFEHDINIYLSEEKKPNDKAGSNNTKSSTNTTSTDPDLSDLCIMDYDILQLPEIQLVKDFKKAYENSKYSDVSFIAENTEFPYAHKIFLSSRSSFFKSLLSSNWRQDQSKTGTHIDMQFKVLKLVIYYLYTNTIMSELDGSTVVGVMLESDALGLGRLKDLCQKYIAARITSDNVQELYSLCIEYEILQLKAACSFFSTKKNLSLSTSVAKYSGSENSPLLNDPLLLADDKEEDDHEPLLI